MLCEIFTGTHQQDAYLYILRGSKTGALPQGLLDLLGPLRKVMLLKIKQDSKLAHEHGAEILQQINQHGFFLQYAAKPESLLTQHLRHLKLEPLTQTKPLH